MTAGGDAPPPRRKPDWVLALLAGGALASVLATVFFWNAWTPSGPDEAQVADWRQRSLGACRAHPDLLAHLGLQAAPYDRLMLVTAQYRFTIHRDGRAELHLFAPEDRRDFTMRIAPADFARLANLVAVLDFERRGSSEGETLDDEGLMSASIGDREAFQANSTSNGSEYVALVQCMRSLQSEDRWTPDTSQDAVIVD